jgi:hypothetical protein
MKRQITLFVIMFSAVLGLQAQDAKFSVHLNADTIKMGAVLELTFSIENIEGQFSPPPFDGFELIAGPSQSTMMSIINGRMTRSSTYIYYLKPLEAGSFMIGEASIKDKKYTYNTSPIQIVVLTSDDFFENIPKPINKAPAQDSTKKRPVYKI